MEMAIKNYQMHLTKASITKQHMSQMASKWRKNAIKNAAAADKIEYWSKKEKDTQQQPGMDIAQTVRRVLTGDLPRSMSDGNLHEMKSK